MESQENKVLRTVTVVFAVLGLGFVMMIAATNFFGGTKVRPLFGASADALAGPPTVISTFEESAAAAPDAGIPPATDAGDAANTATPPAP